ncbi:hypothetical protein HGRIS_010963 [Hohenbuehelia grisea]|uniref:Uncharacterized protein n=1 Tax=Hohenbuehelia grisea TaxID=104357 RepID=A0ABR3IYI8_9AGAR
MSTSHSTTHGISDHHERNKTKNPAKTPATPVHPPERRSHRIQVESAQNSELSHHPRSQSPASNSEHSSSGVITSTISSAVGSVRTLFSTITSSGTKDGSSSHRSPVDTDSRANLVQHAVSDADTATDSKGSASLGSKPEGKAKRPSSDQDRIRWVAEQRNEVHTVIENLRGDLNHVKKLNEKYQISLQQLSQSHQQSTSQLMHLQQHLANTQSVNEKLQSENAILRQQVADLRERKDEAESAADILTLDPFFTRVDQISEAAVISNGNPSLASINAAVDDLVSDLLDTASEFESLQGHMATFQPHFFNQYLLDTLRQPQLKDDARGYLTDAILHDMLSGLLWNTFFADPAVYCARINNLHSNLSALHAEIAKDVPWSVSQRWRAITLANASKSCSPQACIHTSPITDVIIDFVAWAHSTPTEQFDRVGLNKSLTNIFWDAHQLSLIIKRDFLSSQVTVARARRVPTNDKFLSFHPHHSACVWSSMGVRVGDDVVGTYKLGLDLTDEKGAIKYLVKPEVITSALMRTILK